MAQLFYTANTLDIDLGTLRGVDADRAEQVWEGLQALTSKNLTHTYPAVPASDLVRNWPRLESVLDRLL